MAAVTVEIVVYSGDVHDGDYDYPTTSFGIGLHLITFMTTDFILPKLLKAVFDNLSKSVPL